MQQGYVTCDNGDVEHDNENVRCDNGDAACHNGNVEHDNENVRCNNGDATCDNGDAACSKRHMKCSNDGAARSDGHSVYRAEYFHPPRRGLTSVCQGWKRHSGRLPYTYIYMRTREGAALPVRSWASPV